MKTFQAWALLSLVRLSNSFSPDIIGRPRASLVGPLAMPKKVEVLISDADAFERVTLARRATKRFEPRRVPDDLLRKVGKFCELSPCPAEQSISQRKSRV